MVQPGLGGRQGRVLEVAKESKSCTCLLVRRASVKQNAAYRSCRVDNVVYTTRQKPYVYCRQAPGRVSYLIQQYQTVAFSIQVFVGYHDAEDNLMKSL